MASNGVDLYRYQTVTNYRRLAEWAKFAWVKVTDGTGPAQVRGDAQVNGCRAAGIEVGGYHYAQPGDPVRQAAVFLAECKRLNALDIAPALDIEAPFIASVETREFAKRFCREVAAAGHRPAVYMAASWTGIMRPETWDIPGLVIWIAAYGPNDGTRHPTALTRYYTGQCDVHQYTSAGRPPGVSGNTDLNHAHTDITNYPQERRMRDLILARLVNAQGQPITSDGQPTTQAEIWVGNGIERRHVADGAELEGLRFWIQQRGGDNVVHDFADLRVLGEVAIEAPRVEIDYDRFVNDVVDRLVDRIGTITGTLTLDVEPPL